MSTPRRRQDKRGRSALADRHVWALIAAVAVFGVIFGNIAMSEGLVTALIVGACVLAFESVILLFARRRRG